MVRMVVVIVLSAVFLFPALMEAKPYYEGKVITIIVGYSPGGGYDRMARFLAKYLPKFIPGKPSVVVQNMPGANCMICANYIYNIAKPDGFTIGALLRTMGISQLLKVDGVHFDMYKYAWIGSAASEPVVFTIRANLPYQTVEDLKNAEKTLFVGIAGEIDAGSQFVPIIKEYMGAKVKYIVYTASAEIFLAMERNELDGYGVSYISVKPLIDRGTVRPIMRGPLSTPDIKNLPIAFDLTKSKRVKTVVSILAAPDIIGRPFVAPPKTPDSIMNILREAFSKLAQDPQAREEANKLKMNLEYTNAPKTLKILHEIIDQPPDIVSEIYNISKF